MENREPEIEEVRDFLEGKMENDRKAKFEKMLATDTLFAKEFQLKKVLLSGMDTYFSKNLKKRLEEEEKGHNGKRQIEKNRHLKVYRISAIAASLLLILFSTFQIWFSIPNHEKVFTEYYQTYPNVVDGTERQAKQDNLSPFKLYENRKYNAAITAFKTALQSKPDDIRLNFYLALSYLTMENAEEAIPYFERNQTNPKEDELQEANAWFLGLAYIKVGNLEKALQILSEISQSESSYREDAKEVLEKLK